MKDEELIELFYARSERAITETSQKYRCFCEKIANNILNNRQDTEECMSDSLLKVWNSIPPARPSSLAAYLARIVRNTALHVYERKCAQKRGSGAFALLLSELEECVGDPSQDSVVESMLIRSVLNRFLDGLNPEQRAVFVRRYWTAQPIEQIAAEIGVSKSKVESMLFRLRNRLREELKKEGIMV